MPTVGRHAPSEFITAQIVPTNGRLSTDHPRAIALMGAPTHPNGNAAALHAAVIAARVFNRGRSRCQSRRRSSVQARPTSSSVACAVCVPARWHRAGSPTASASINDGVSRGCSSAGCCTTRQHAGLQLQVHHATGTLLQVQSRSAAVQFGAHASTHLQHIGIQRGRIAFAAQRLCAPVRNRPAGWHHRPRRVHVPGPGVPRSTRVRAGIRCSWPTKTPVNPCRHRAQAHVDVVQTAGGGDRTEQRHHLLRQPRIPAPRFQRTCAIAGLHAGRIVVHTRSRSEPKPKPSEAAVADDREAPTRNHAVCRAHVRARPSPARW